MCVQYMAGNHTAERGTVSLSAKKILLSIRRVEYSGLTCTLGHGFVADCQCVRFNPMQSNREECVLLTLHIRTQDVYTI